jgi:hypothetical protein
LASHDLEYKFTVKRLVTDKKEQTEALLKLFDIKFKEVLIEEEKATIKSEANLPKEITDKLEEDIKRLVALKEVAIIKQ